MRFVILGAGALGSILAGHLARAGEDVVVVARGYRADYMRQHGITLTGLADFKQLPENLSRKGFVPIIG